MSNGSANPPVDDSIVGPGGMTRILYYIPLLLLGGTERQLANLVMNLDRRRFEPLVWAADGQGPVGDMLRDAGVPVRAMAVDFADPEAIEHAVCWIRSAGPTIFQSCGYGDEWCDVVLARFAGIPLCISRRGNLRHWDPDAPPRFPEILRNAGSDIVVANSRAVAEYCERIERIRPEKIRVIHNGVEPPHEIDQQAARGELGLGPEDLVAGNVANLRPVKGHDNLLLAFRRVADSIPNAKLVICGEGETRADLERLSRNLNLQERVIFTGFRRDAAGVYAALDVYVSSAFSEGLSNAILEAMHCGLPVVATGVGGTAESVTDGVTGLLTPARDPGGLATAIIRLLGDPRLRQAMGEEGHARAREAFSIRRMVQQYENLYFEELGRRGLA